MKKKEFVVDVERWGKRRLLKKSGKMCCLGFCAKQIGASDFDILNEQREPKKQSKYHHNYCVIIPRSLRKKAAYINDGDLKPLSKARSLRKLFRDYGITLRFINTKSLYL